MPNTWPRRARPKSNAFKPKPKSIKRLQERERNAQAYAKHPALLRMLELETSSELARNGNVRIHIGFDKHITGEAVNDGD